MINFLVIYLKFGTGIPSDFVRPKSFCTLSIFFSAFFCGVVVCVRKHNGEKELRKTKLLQKHQNISHITFVVDIFSFHRYCSVTHLFIWCDMNAKSSVNTTVNTQYCITHQKIRKCVNTATAIVEKFSARCSVCDIFKNFLFFFSILLNLHCWFVECIETALVRVSKQQTCFSHRTIANNNKIYNVIHSDLNAAV